MFTIHPAQRSRVGAADHPETTCVSPRENLGGATFAFPEARARSAPLPHRHPNHRHRSRAPHPDRPHASSPAVGAAGRLRPARRERVRARRRRGDRRRRPIPARLGSTARRTHRQSGRSAHAVARDSLRIGSDSSRPACATTGQAGRFASAPAAPRRTRRARCLTTDGPGKAATRSNTKQHATRAVHECSWSVAGRRSGRPRGRKRDSHRAGVP